MHNPAPPYDAAYRRCLGLTLAVIAFALCAVVVGTGSASAAGPTCPSGSTYNKATKQCETSAIVYCPAGSAYDPATGLCTAAPTRNCASPGEYNSTTGRCEAPVCGSDEFHSDINPVDANCRVGGPDGYLEARQCPEGYTLQMFSGGVCWAEPESACTVGSYDADRDVCVAGVAQFACPQYYRYDAQSGKCQTPPLKATKPPRT